MPALVIYILKLSISLAAVYVFYYAVLRKLTFYSWNRWYLLAYSFLSLFIPFLDISPLFEREPNAYTDALRIVPAINFHAGKSFVQHVPPELSHSAWSSWSIAFLFMMAGIVILTARLSLQYISFLRLRRKAQLFSSGETNVYHVNEPIIPFSFGNSVFINPQLHPAAELEEIIRHEFVHVRQRHSIDIVWSELLCIINWYNPYTWLLKSAIRHNLEFIADQKVLDNGINRKEYQYLLLKVVGNNQFSVAPKFNFSSLKKRIAMMNKIRSARHHIARFLFVLPLAAILLLAFRDNVRPEVFSRQRASTKSPGRQIADPSVGMTSGDTTPVRNKNSKEVDRDRTSDKFEITDKKATIHLRSGKVEEYDLTDSIQGKRFENIYGKIITIAASTDVEGPVSVITTSEINSVVNGEVRTSVEPVIVTTNGKVATTTPATVANSTATVISATPGVNEVAGVEDAADAQYGDEAILLTITKRTTAAELDELKKQMKDKGFELKFDKTTYSDKGTLIYVRGSLSSSERHCTFTGSHFEELIISRLGTADHPHFKIEVRESKRVII